MLRLKNSYCTPTDIIEINARLGVSNIYLWGVLREHNKSIMMSIMMNM